MLRLISYLAPSIPAGFFRLVARVIAEECREETDLRFDETISGPLPGDSDPFGEGNADIGFVCAPTFRWLHESLDLLPVPVPLDPRAGGRPVYFADVVVAPALRATRFDELRGARWAYNDRNSRSGWFSMIEAVAPEMPETFFSALIHSGSHLESLRMLRDGSADAAAIDSNALLCERAKKPHRPPDLRVIESWGPFPIQPVVIRSGAPADLKRAAREALLRAHESHGSELRSFGFERFTEAGTGAYLGPSAVLTRA